jgi:hypothetical protein
MPAIGDLGGVGAAGSKTWDPPYVIAVSWVSISKIEGDLLYEIITLVRQPKAPVN